MNRWVAVLIAFAVSACAGQPPAGEDSYPSDIAGRATLSVATTRAAVPDFNDPWYGIERAEGIQYARVNLISPHKSGRFTLASTGIVDWRLASVEQTEKLHIPLSRSGGPQDVLIYVHGFNTNFRKAVLDGARLSDGVGFRGETVVFTWPSRGKLLDYVPDRENAVWSRDELEATFTQMLRDPSVGRIHVVAHSMGAMLTVEALRQVSSAIGSEAAQRFGAIVFASPDVDYDVFAASVARLDDLRPRMLVVSATDDRALAISASLAGNSRAGSLDQDRLAKLGIRVVDASGSGGLIRHNAFLKNDEAQDAIAQAISQARKRPAAPALGDPGIMVPMAPITSSPLLPPAPVVDATGLPAIH